MTKPTLGYWDIRGLAEPIRFILHFKNVDFMDKRYVFTTNDWPNDKFTLGLDFPNLPYYIEGDIKLTQSLAIMRYLAQKYGLDGKDDLQKSRVHMAEQTVADHIERLRSVILSNDYEAAKVEFIKNMPSVFKLWEKFFGDGKYIAGEDITYVDFLAYETFDFYRLIYENALEGFPTLQAFQKRIKNLPELQDYFSSSVYKRWPVFGPSAKFGGGGEEPNHA
ncbi:glutathione S-transferase [Caerostris darwini]|uniref:glutathione transferase n=1 Tax=Caerostris darwini TaxID=1538125 RepID=A0AAV4UIL6_9ARAC|nr:glutathione S-transferase [Caerostris darwini]